MRDVAWIWDAWKSGEYVGDRKFSTRVTVEPSFFLTATDPIIGPWTRGPARWFQRDLPDGAHPVDGSGSAQHEVEIPDIVSYNHSRSVEQDAGTVDLTIVNTTMPSFGMPEMPAGQFGDPGHFTWDHGLSQEARARWGHVVNEWQNVLVPSALLRTYQGFGGEDKPLEQALADGNIVLNGVWMIDDVVVTADGTISVKGRDMGNLLVDQQLYPPLVPSVLFPLLYERYIIEDYTIEPDPESSDRTIINQPTIYGIDGPAPFSSTDVTYGSYDTGVTGHRPSLAVDWTPDPADQPGSYTFQQTYWMSEPKASAADHVWIEFGNEFNDINIIYFHPWAGNYLVYVSVFENGGWVAPEGGGQGGIGPDGVPYVFSFTSNWEGGNPPGVETNQYAMPRIYRSQRIRLTITNLVHAAEGGFRAGARMVIGQLDRSVSSMPRWSFAAAALPYNTDNHTGYWQVRSDGRLFAFGDARTYRSNGPAWVHDQPVLAMNAHPSGNGYWTMDFSGRVIGWGDATWFGDDETLGHHDAMDFAVAPDGNGYWILHRDGLVSHHGSAGGHGNSIVFGTMVSGVPVIARSIESHPSIDGYWVLWSDGTVDAHNLTHYGNATSRDGFRPTEYVGSIRRTHDGAGYWVTSGGGIVQAKGNAPHVLDAPPYEDANWSTGLIWDLIPYSESDTGYALQRADGSLVVAPDFEEFGSFAEHIGHLRKDGNYKDYADIVRELLLWAGFYLYKNPAPGTEFPHVYGNIESTGAFSKDFLPTANFDKRPVIDAIRWIKGLVGYVFFIDAEGGARFESPNWWAMGNYLIDGTPFGYMPEIDEAVQLVSHSVTYSAQPARSKIIIATQDPAPQLAGQARDLASITVTELTPSSAGDLKGKLSPIVWPNIAFTSPSEQRVMAELIDMQMWFQRRTANVSCVANPLIDVNDQVRVIERQSGETYVHYVKGIAVSHDLATGDATMNLTTHWLGGTPYGSSTLYFAADATPLGDGYWQVTASGTIYAYGNAGLFTTNEDDSHTEWVITLHTTPTGDGFYTLDVSGKVLTYGDAEQQGHLFHTANDVIDMAVTPSGHGYWILTTNGTVHTFGDAINYGSATVSGLMPSGSPIKAQNIESHPTTQGYWILLSNGTVQAFNLPHHGDADRAGFTFTEYVHDLRRTHDGSGYWIVSGSGLVQNFNAPHHGDAAEWHDNYAGGLVWSMISNDADGYGLQRAIGQFEMFEFTPAGDAFMLDTQPLTWALVPLEQFRQLNDPPGALPVSPDLMKFLAKTGSPAANNAVTSNFGFAPEPTIKAPVE